MRREERDASTDGGTACEAAAKQKRRTWEMWMRFEEGRCVATAGRWDTSRGTRGTSFANFPGSRRTRL